MLLLSDHVDIAKEGKNGRRRHEDIVEAGLSVAKELEVEVAGHLDADGLRRRCGCAGGGCGWGGRC